MMIISRYMPCKRIISESERDWDTLRENRILNFLETFDPLFTKRNMSPVDIGVVQRKTQLLEAYIKELDQFSKIASDRYLNDFTLQRAVERTLELSIQCVIDLGSHILTSHFH